VVIAHKQTEREYGQYLPCLPTYLLQLVHYRKRSQRSTEGCYLRTPRKRDGPGRPGSASLTDSHLIFAHHDSFKFASNMTKFRMASVREQNIKSAIEAVKNGCSQTIVGSSERKFGRGRRVFRCEGRGKRRKWVCSEERGRDQS
jgi:hypothetical protein